MFYEVLMEKKAQQSEERQQPRLSTGQKVGVGAAGATGAVMGAGALGVGALKNKRLRTFIEEGTKKERGARAAAMRQFDSVRDRMRDLESTLFDSTTAADLRALKKNPNLPAESSEALDKLIEARRRSENIGGMPMGSDEKRKLRGAVDDARYAFEDVLAKKRGEAADVRDKALDALQSKRLRRNKLLLGGSMLGGGLAVGYGAKKLFDRYNRRKQRKG